MKKSYSTPHIEHTSPICLLMQNPSLSGNTGDGNTPIGGGGGDDNGGDGDPDTKQRGGFDGWGDLW
ncbi:MAG: hypothetical protein Q4E32_05170 [Bacteroidales bacterium]|nr:hypothetical protein [Bacteroidales bacterium]